MAETAYCSVAQLKSRFRIGDGADDVELAGTITSASQWVNNYCNRYFWSGAAVRTYQPDSYYCLDVDDLVSVTSLKTDASADGVFETTWSASDYQLLPTNPSASGETWPYTEVSAVGSRTFPYSARRGTVEVSGVFGWPAVPAPVVQATMLVASELFRLRDAPFGVAGFGEFGAVRVRENPKVAELLDPYVKSDFGVA